MFTGLVEEKGIVRAIRHAGQAIQIVVESRVCGDVKIGDSLAVNGCCLTVVKKSGSPRKKLLQMDLLQETWKRTSFSQLKVGAGVNLERSLLVGSRLGGHFVTGHIDDPGVIRRLKTEGADILVEVEAPKAFRHLLIPKGSIALDGISLTVADVLKTGFRVWIIPHTWEVTALSERKVGDKVNLEFDMIGKYAMSNLKVS